MDPNQEETRNLFFDTINKIINPVKLKEKLHI